MTYSKADQLKTKRHRKRKCKSCREWFRPDREGQEVCTKEECAVAYGKVQYFKQRRKEAKESKQNSRSKLKKRAEEACNHYIRKRDEGLPCISCGYIWVSPEIGRKQNAGHYQSVGKRSDLRYNELNIHLQCEQCNTHLSGNAVPYRDNLIKKIGDERVEMLESNNVPRSYSDEELRGIENLYKKKLKDLE